MWPELLNLATGTGLSHTLTSRGNRLTTPAQGPGPLSTAATAQTSASELQSRTGRPSVTWLVPRHSGETAGPGAPNHAPYSPPRGTRDWAGGSQG